MIYFVLFSFLFLWLYVYIDIIVYCSFVCHKITFYINIYLKKIYHSIYSIKWSKFFFFLMVIKLDFIFFGLFWIWSKWLSRHQDPESRLLSESRKSISRDSICQFQSIFQSFTFILRLPVCLEIAALTYLVSPSPLLKCRPTDINKRPTNWFSLMASQFAASLWVQDCCWNSFFAYFKCRYRLVPLL